MTAPRLNPILKPPLETGRTASRETSLSYRLLFHILLASSLVTLVLTVVQLYTYYHQDLRLVEDQMDQIRSSYLESLELSVWLFDDSQIRKQMEGILQLRDIQYLNIRTEYGLDFTAGKMPEPANSISRDFTLSYEYEGRVVELGTLRVASELTEVYKRLIDKAFVILLTQGIKTFLVSLFILFICHRMITRHLSHMASYVRRLDIHRLDEPLVLQRPDADLPAEDEIAAVAGAINTLREDLQHYIRERDLAEAKIRDHNVLLEEAVEKKTREMEDIAAKMLRQEKLATIGQISASIAHELRNPLGAIKQAIYYLKRKIHDPSGHIPEFLTLIETEVFTADKVITDLLEISRLKEPYRKTVDLAGLVREAAERARINDPMRLTLDLLPDPFLLQVDPQQMVQVLVNLFTNARDACSQEQAGILEVSARSVEDGAQYAIQIRDNGGGVSPQHIRQVFEPLFTTKGKGTGLGLSVCKQIVEKHGGQIAIGSRQEKGTSVTIHLPRVGEGGR